MTQQSRPYRRGIHDNYLAIIGTGARCRTCARMYTNNRNTFGHQSFCSSHNNHRYSEEAVLGRLCCQWQDRLLALLWRRRSTVLHLWPGITAAEFWQWHLTNRLWLQCEVSLYELAPIMQLYLDRRWMRGICYQT